ncbi:HNH endonuclease [Leptospira noguchii]|uniref:HNH endonuclease n=1 Tax=Leptospira noguchii TaxID=28182 RepID=UPI0009C13E94|nr:hypothetical protein [Leptospira noguchii]
MEERYKFTGKDFFEILDKQGEKCYLSGRILTPDITLAEHIIPIRYGGRFSKDNTCLVIEPLARLKRYYKEEEIMEIAVDIINNKGSKYGFKITTSKKTKK